MKITTLEMANVKRIKALRLVPSEKGLTIIGGKNSQGKTSVLDAIAYGLGGGKYRPTNLRREGAVGDTFIHIETDNGLVIDRKDGERSLRVRDEQGNSSGQKLLDRFISELAIDLPKFHNAPSKDKAKMLLHALGVDAEIAKLDADEKAKFDTRTVIGRQADQKEKAAKDMEWYEDAPAEPVSVKELIERQQAILARNGHRQECAARRDRNAKRLEEVMARMAELADERVTLVAEIEKDEKAVAEAGAAESTAEIEASITNIEETNRKVAVNAERARRIADADALRDQYDALTKEIEDVRKAKLKILEGAKMPLDGLTVENGELLLDGKAWDCMSGSQQLVVDCAIASRLNPECKFILLDKLEQFDLDTLAEFGKWLEAQDLQCIATRVSTNSDGECSIVIEDGEAEAEAGAVAVPFAKKPAAPQALGDDDF